MGISRSNSAGSYTDEQVRDVIGTALVAGANVTITPNDGADTITIDAAYVRAEVARCKQQQAGRDRG